MSKLFVIVGIMLAMLATTLFIIFRFLNNTIENNVDKKDDVEEEDSVLNKRPSWVNFDNPFEEDELV